MEVAGMTFWDYVITIAVSSVVSIVTTIIIRSFL